TDCVLPECGDGVIDNGEECDEGRSYNSDEIPGRCRRNCKAAKCGDGFLDFTQGEICDDGNNNPSDGCHNCYPCYLPKDDLVLSADYGEILELCQGRYEFTDNGQEGVIIVNGYGATLDCKGATLVGLPPVTPSAVQNMNVPFGINEIKQGLNKARSRFDKRKKTDTSDSNQSGSGNTAPQLPRSATGYQGTGIVVNGQDVVIMNCNIEGFKQGIRLKSSGAVLVNNNICENQNDIKSDGNQNYGLKNSCGKYQNWQENGSAGCMSSCGQ
ncbi:MAG: DUF4215 domain-containing protein, partial [Candidatus Omnitrophota bacterium]